MKMAEAREKQKAATLNTRMSELNRFSFCSETVERKCGAGIRGWGGRFSPSRRGCGERMVLGGGAVGDNYGGEAKKTERKES
uniref:Uncharacterized protein n=1 Tax=Rhizophora mucronata TaxID=61149 RepID=A0A2P2QFA4_RHIMU